MWESTRIQNILYNDTIVTSFLSSFLDDTTVNRFCIFNNNIVPLWCIKKDYPNTINYYRSGNISGGLEYGEVIYTINCRGNEIFDAENIQEAVYNALNRKASDTTGFFICTVLQTIEPKDSTDNYNAPIEVRIKTK